MTRSSIFFAGSAVILIFAIPVLGQNQDSQGPPAATTPSESSMTNADVIKMVKGGLSEALVITTIRSAKNSAFILTPEALIELKAAGISEYILTVMVDPKADIPYSAPAQASPQSNIVDDNPLAPHDAGIYVELEKHNPRLVLLEPAVFSQGKTGGVFVSKLTYGIAKSSWKAVVRGRTANQRVEVKQPTFYFYFEQKSAGLSNTGAYSWFGGASSPNEFVLARMDQTRNGRELIVGESGTFGASAGTRSKDTVNLNIERLAPGVYRVRPAEPLEVDKEYCFFYGGGASGGGAIAQLGGIGVSSGVTPAGKLFDFGVDAADVRKSK